jgi:hypothetical protein
MKTGISVKVTNQESQNYGREGLTIIVNSYHSMIEEFGTGKVFNESNKNLQSCSHVTRAGDKVAKVESEALASMETRIDQFLVTLYALASQAAGYPTQFAKGSVHAYQTAIAEIEKLKNPKP